MRLRVLFLMALAGIGAQEINPTKGGRSALNPTITTIAFASCSDAERESLWGKVAETNPDSLILLGDNIYADTKVGAGPGGMDMVFGSTFIPANQEAFDYQYGLLKEDAEFSALLASVGGWKSGNIRATFDDHDYGVNNGDKFYAGRNISQAAFWDFMETEKDSTLRDQEGVYNSHTFRITSPLGLDAAANGSSSFTYKVIMMDARSNKDAHPKQQKGGAAARAKAAQEGDFLGEEQWQWLERELADPEPDLILLGSGIQVLPDDKILEETWFEFPQARNRLLGLVQHTRAHYTPNVFILSGDIHTGEVLEAQWQCDKDEEEKEDVCGTRCEELARMWEFTSSGLSHTFTKSTHRKDSLMTDEQREMVASMPPSMCGEDEGIEISRGLAYELLYNMYTAISVSHYRRNRYGQHYRGLHFGRLRITHDGGGGGGGVYSGFMMTFDILDQFNRPQMTTHHRLLSKHSGSGGDNLSRYTHKQCRAVPFHGPVPRWRLVLADYGLFGLPFFAFFLPLCIAVTLLFTAVRGVVEAAMDLLFPAPSAAASVMATKQLEALTSTSTKGKGKDKGKNKGKDKGKGKGGEEEEKEEVASDVPAPPPTKRRARSSSRKRKGS